MVQLLCRVLCRSTCQRELLLLRLLVQWARRTAPVPSVGLAWARRLFALVCLKQVGNGSRKLLHGNLWRMPVNAPRQLGWRRSGRLLLLTGLAPILRVQCVSQACEISCGAGVWVQVRPGARKGLLLAPVVPRKALHRRRFREPIGRTLLSVSPRCLVVAVRLPAQGVSFTVPSPWRASRRWNMEGCFGR